MISIIQDSMITLVCLQAARSGQHCSFPRIGWHWVQCLVVPETIIIICMTMIILNIFNINILAGWTLHLVQRLVILQHGDQPDYHLLVHYPHHEPTNFFSTDLHICQDASTCSVKNMLIIVIIVITTIITITTIIIIVIMVIMTNTDLHICQGASTCSVKKPQH